MGVSGSLKRALERSIAAEAHAAPAAVQAKAGRAKHLLLGDSGEELAARYLAGLGFRILCRNVRAGRCEIDIIARDGDELVFAEVRTRSANPVAAPEDSVGPRKLERLIRGASLWTEEHNYNGCWRIDLVAVTVEGNKAPKIEHFRSITEPMA